MFTVLINIVPFRLTLPSLTTNCVPSSFLHIIFGGGRPMALQVSNTSWPSLATTSELVSSVIMSGETEIWSKRMLLRTSATSAVGS